MSAQCPINSTTIDVLGQYNQTAKHLIAAYRLGTARAVAGAGERYEQFLGARALVSEGVKERLIGAEQKAGQFVVGVVGRISDVADGWADGLAQRAVTGVERFDEKTAWSHDLALVNALRKLNLPVAKASLRVAEQVTDVSRRLSERAAGQPAVVVEAVKTVKSGVKKAQTGVKKAQAGTQRVQRAVRARA